MGVDSRKPPPLPAPTETETNTPTELSTELSRPGDEQSTYSIPDDGTPVTIRTRGHRANKSQTSLLIEYFEGGRTPASGSSTERKPSVRVRLTPSKKRHGDHIQLTETKGSRKASLTRRIPLDQALESREIELHGEDAHSLTSYASATEESNVSRNPIDIEIDRSHRRRRPASPLIPSAESYQPGNPSEISAIPADSFLDGSAPTADEKRSLHPGNTLAAAAAGAAAGAAMGELSSSKTRGKDRARTSTEKIKDRSDRKRRPKSRTSSLSEQTEEIKSPRRRSGRTHQESTLSGADSSILSSQLSADHRSLDAHSMRSGASRSSINNPKLLETVEDAIRRLILPELNALKREQSKREGRRGSLTSTGTSVSRDDLSMDRRRSSGQRTDLSKDIHKSKERRNREARHDYEEVSLRSPSQVSLDGEYSREYGETVTPKRGDGLLKAAAMGAAGAAIGKTLSKSIDDQAESDDRRQRERRRRRTESARSRSLGREKYSETYDDDFLGPAPPMPLMSDINPSEMTRTSILSADSDRHHSASEEFTPLRETSRGMAMAEETSSGPHTPGGLQEAFSTKHANVSHGDLTALPRGKDKFDEEYETDEFGRKIPLDQGEFAEHRDRAEHQGGAESPENDYESQYYSTQDVPAPLKYVPYQAGARGLSPIPSVSGYTEGGSEAPVPRSSRSMNSVSDISAAEDYGRPLHSPSSVPSNMRSRDFDGLALEERGLGADRRNTTYTEGSQDDTGAGQAVRGIGANPNFVYPGTGVESAVASLVDGSMIDQSVLTSGSGHDYGNPVDSMLSYDGQENVRGQSSRDMSPEKMSLDSRRDYDDQRRATPGSRSHDHSQDASEYEIDEHGRKFHASKYRQSPTASEAAITAGAVGAAAAALKLAQERRQVGSQSAWQGDGVVRNKSFKERTMEGREPRGTPAHSIDRFDDDEPAPMGISGLPDVSDPIPEIGYVDDDMQTNPSVVHDRLDGEYDGYISGRATPTQRSVGTYDETQTPTRSATGEARGLGIAETAGVAALGAAGAMAALHSREASMDAEERQRTSDEHKRPLTWATNPYENASPIANGALDDRLLAYQHNFHTGSPGLSHRQDEGYSSNGPNRTPDIEPRGKALDISAPIAETGEDPFYVPKGSRHLSGMSQGMGSPFYDAATGGGIDRIENKDILALMQHLMVRDAQRSARDTEIVALLMNAALEMRTGFRDMKDLIQDTGDDMIFANVENTEKLQKSITGPRPLPGTGARSIQSGSAAGTMDDANSKKKNLWRRALQGLSAKGTSDLSRIEDMLMQLLGDVDVLKKETGAPGSSGEPGQSLETLQPEGQYENDRGYEPEGNSTASYGSPSGHRSLSRSKGQPSRAGDERDFPDHRISTVPEIDEEYQYGHPSPSADRADLNLLSPAPQEMRAGSVPLDTPPQPAHLRQQPLSAENTPRTDKGKTHKSAGSSGWIPKFSRWSETTASSVGRAFRGSGVSKKDPRYDGTRHPSRSASSLGSYDEGQYEHDPYEEDHLHTGFSDPNLHQAGEPSRAAPPPSMQAYMTPEDPKYKAHRNSLNLQHPQPRTGQTEHFRTLEYSAQAYDTPLTPKSADWAGSATSLNRLPQNSHRLSGASSAAQARDAEYWPSSPPQTGGPPRPPKEALGSAMAQTPPKSSRASKIQQSSPLSRPGYESNYSMMTGGQDEEYDGSPKLENRNLSTALGVPARRPSGPRAMTPKTLEEEAAREERRRKRATFGSVESETF